MTHPLYEWSALRPPAGRPWVRKEPFATLAGTGGRCLLPAVSGATFGLCRRLTALCSANISTSSGSLPVAGKVGLEIRDQCVRPACRRAVDRRRECQSSRRKSSGQSYRQAGGRAGRSEMEISNPKLWWPAGMGAQPLGVAKCTSNYVMIQVRSIDLADPADRFAHFETAAARDKEEVHSEVEVNGDFRFCRRGANWIPETGRFRTAFPRRNCAVTLRPDAVAVNGEYACVSGGVAIMRTTPLFRCLR